MATKSKSKKQAGEITLLLSGISDPESMQTLFNKVYGELRLIARRHCRRESSARTLQATELVHETVLRLIQGSMTFYNRRHFFASVGRSMRRIMVERARQRTSLKRGGAYYRVDFEDAEVMGLKSPSQVLELNNALNQIQIVCPAWRTIVDLRLFSGISTRETAELLGIGESTARRRWAHARSWLKKELSAEVKR